MGLSLPDTTEPTKATTCTLTQQSRVRQVTGKINDVDLGRSGLPTPVPMRVCRFALRTHTHYRVIMQAPTHAKPHPGLCPIITVIRHNGECVRVWVCWIVN